MRTSFYQITLLLLFISIPLLSQAQESKQRGIAILDLISRNAETNDAELFSAEHIVKVAGIPYIITSDIALATTYAVVLSSSKLERTTLTSTEKTLLKDYVYNGGVFITPTLKDGQLFKLFGVSNYSHSNQRFKITWNINNGDPAFKWINEPEEITISLGNPSYKSEIFTTRHYILAGAQPMAFYEDTTVAATKYSYGNGFSYVIGCPFKDLVSRNLLNLDYDAQRAYSNIFEPTTDAVIFYIKGIFLSHVPYATYKHTSPYGSKSTLMVTHDVDATTSMQFMGKFLRMEDEYKIPASYYITTHYIRDKQAKDYYRPFIDSIRRIDQVYHQEIGSHSVGHFPDFDIESRFPLGSPGNTMHNYNPYYDGVRTLNGTVYGELEVSKNLLETEIQVPVRTFRAGELLYHDRLINVMDELGYQYNTTRSAANVLTHFPFRARKNRTFSGPLSSVWEIPMTISDVFYGDPFSSINYAAKANSWTYVMNKLYDNNAPCILLIHPNRDYKIDAFKLFLQQLPEKVHLDLLENFGDYWKARDTFAFDTQVADNVMTITIPDKFYPLDPKQSIIIENGKSLAAIIVKTESGIPVVMSSSAWEGNSIILHTQQILPARFAFDMHETKTELLSDPYPNPFNSTVQLSFTLPTDAEVALNIYDLSGRKIRTLVNGFEEAKEHNIIWDGLDEYGNSASKGVYMCELKVDGLSAGTKRIVHIP